MFQDIARLKNTNSRRSSSWDRTGRNLDFIAIRPGETATLLDVDGAGAITHLWFTVNHLDYYYPRRLIFRAAWDGSENSSVECPLGDFFGVGHGMTSHYSSLLTNQVGDPDYIPNKVAFNSFFPMPFRKGAKLTITNNSPLTTISFYFYVDYHLVDDPTEVDGRGYFHCQYNQFTGGEDGSRPGQLDFSDIEPPNLDGAENFVMLDAKGRGHYLGCALSIDNWDASPPTYWFGEGDDMIFIDGEAFPPSLHGTGTEDYFCAAWGYPANVHGMPFHGVSFQNAETKLYDGQWSMYRHHVEDPVRFTKSIRATIERGHGNISRADYSSAAYYYLDAPVAANSKLGDTESYALLPRFKSEHQRTAYSRMEFVLKKYQAFCAEIEKKSDDYHPYLGIPRNIQEIVGKMARAYHNKKYHDCMKTCDEMLGALSSLKGA